MKLFVDQDLCIACGACISLCPEVYDWNDDGKADVTVDEIPSDVEESAADGMDSCPTEAIQEKK
ncbi:MAG: ferredoxin [Peptococcaceae bacterium BICA1-8]|nr:MAG: ferredoxin [Clostridiaceae bacterium BRH_c20a]KJS83011.1 MAG: ferredoxin [Peptococcaceae bacterium BICA1-8]